MKKSFEEAQSSCASNGGKLFEPRNLQQNKEVADAVFEINGYDGYEFWWIGVDDKEKEGSFQWSTSKQSTNFSNWSSGQPNNFYGNQDCVNMLTSYSANSDIHGKWYDTPCTELRPFICVFKYDPFDLPSYVDGSKISKV